MSNELLYQEATDSSRSLQAQREPTQGRVRALIGDGNGTAAANLVGWSGVPWVKVRLGGDVNQLAEAYNGNALVAAADMPVTLLVKYREGRVDHYEVEKVNFDVAWPGWIPGTSGGLPAHAESHEIRGNGTGGWDAVNVYERAITSLRVNAQTTPDLTVQVAPGYYNIDGVELYYAGGNSPAMTPPGSGLEFDVVCIDASGVISIEAAALTSPPVTFTFSTTGLIPLAAIQLIAGQTSIVESDILDVRPFMSLSTPSAAYSLTVEEIDGTPLVSGVTTIKVSNGTLTDNTGGVVTITTTGLPHDLLDGTVDQDTLAGSVVLGDLIHGNGTPKWARLAGQITTTRKFLRQTGTGTISAVPAWDVLVAADLPNTAVTPGTYGDATNVGQFTVDAQGRITGATDVPITGGGHVIQDEGTPLTQRANLNFVGSGVVATDDAGNDASVVTISGWSILANGDPASPAVVFSAGGDVIAVPF